MSAAAVKLPAAANAVLHSPDGNIVALASDHQLVLLRRVASTEVLPCHSSTH